MEREEKESKILKCSACNTEVPEGALICTVCSAPLPATASPKKSMCPHCYAEFPLEVEFCPSCGSKTKQITDKSQVTTCPRCYSEIEPDLAYCPQCGSDLSPSLICPKCKGKIPPGMSRCPVCGTSRKDKGVSSFSIHQKLRKQREINRITTPSENVTPIPDNKHSLSPKMHSTTFPDRELEESNPEKKKEEKINQPGYLVCNSCGGYYKLQPGEYPADFKEKCPCGGKLQHQLKL
ncbi:zinc ribbon domain-containing protein [Methanobacterium sp. BAmetb5]|uniref:zinc ribbon domain-containing protein n=1 Tax=Methanobacterium sp. BAmetb5 TaxID=2025351 RepID=UPI000E98F4C8|nr:zinc ribbon domain-containing protein [Methanobacterium sp. BAmetb5]AXV39072.1 MAG: hypothetical protein CIT02_01465 [Methanobacterium sp. BAmetb5]